MPFFFDRLAGLNFSPPPIQKSISEAAELDRPADYLLHVAERFVPAGRARRGKCRRGAFALMNASASSKDAETGLLETDCFRPWQW